MRYASQSYHIPNLYLNAGHMHQLYSLSEGATKIEFSVANYTFYIRTITGPCMYSENSVSRMGRQSDGTRPLQSALISCR